MKIVLFETIYEHVIDSSKANPGSSRGSFPYIYRKPRCPQIGVSVVEHSSSDV
jgi:hypothetical protein